MRDAFLLVDTSSTAQDLIREISAYGFTYLPEDDTYIFTDGYYYLEIRRDDSIIQYYDEDDYVKMDRLGISFGYLGLFAMLYKDPALLLDLLKSLSALQGLWFDNAHGLILPVAELISRTDSNPSWDWPMDDGDASY